MTKNWCGAFCDLSVAHTLEFNVDDTWKTTFSKPGGLCALGCLSPSSFLAVRVSIAVAWLCCCIWSFVAWVDFAPAKYWFTKLTHWTALLELAYFACASVTTYMAIYSGLPDGDYREMPWIASLTWFLGSITIVGSFLVFALYWGLVYSGGTPEIVSVVMHGGNFLFAFIDLLLIRRPVHLLHVLAPVGYATCFLLFSLLYYAVGGTYEDGESPYIYAALDWSNPGATGKLGALILIIVVPVVFITFYFIAWCRLRCRRAGEAKIAAAEAKEKVAAAEAKEYDAP